MKEEQNASSSANYDVEMFHRSAAHAAILKGSASPSSRSSVTTYVSFVWVTLAVTSCF